MLLLPWSWSLKRSFFSVLLVSIVSFADWIVYTVYSTLCSQIIHRIIDECRTIPIKIWSLIRLEVQFSLDSVFLIFRKKSLWKSIVSRSVFYYEWNILYSFYRNWIHSKPKNHTSKTIELMILKLLILFWFPPYQVLYSVRSNDGLELNRWPTLAQWQRVSVHLTTLLQLFLLTRQLCCCKITVSKM